MAEPLKNHFGPDVPARIAEMVGSMHRPFDRDAFLADALDGFEDLELTPRARHISAALRSHLPQKADEAIDVLVRSLGSEIEGVELSGMGSFIYLPFVFFVADYGLECFEDSMVAQYELTKRFTAEFSIRAYLEHHLERTLDRLREWTQDPNVHVRRLVSEGTRPRLPWAPRLRQFQKDPAPVIELLERLKDDPEEYVRRSVANNLNDIAKDHPALVVEVASRWAADADETRMKLIRHGLRTLVKAGDPGALGILGYAPDSAAVVRSVECTPERVAIGGTVRIEVEVHNPSDGACPVLLDLRVEFVKANGSRAPKVFKGAELLLEPGGSGRVRKTVSIRQHSTRKHYPGVHRVDVMVNGGVRPGRDFEVTA